MSLIPENTPTLEIELVDLLRDQILEPSPGFSATSDLYENGLDSLAIMQLLVALEEKYGVTISDAELSTENFRSARGISRLLQSRLASR